jgi:archaellum component FlaF (FlaF/FlaG flagellin family)
MGRCIIPKNLKKLRSLYRLYLPSLANVQAYEDRLIKISNDYKSRGIQIVANSPNDPNTVRIDELGYTTLNDNYEDMISQDEDKEYLFPYIYTMLSFHN